MSPRRSHCLFTGRLRGAGGQEVGRPGNPTAGKPVGAEGFGRSNSVSPERARWTLMGEAFPLDVISESALSGGLELDRTVVKAVFVSRVGCRPGV